MDALAAAYSSGSDSSDGEKEDYDIDERAKRQKMLGSWHNPAPANKTSPASSTERPNAHTLQRVQERYAFERERERERAGMAAVASATTHSPPVYTPPEFGGVLNEKMPDYLQKRIDYALEQSGGRNCWPKDWIMQLEAHSRAVSPLGLSPMQLEAHNKAVSSVGCSPTQLEGHNRAGDAVRQHSTMLQGHNNDVSAARWAPTHELDSVQNGRVLDYVQKNVNYASEKSGGSSHSPQERILQLEGHNRAVNCAGWSLAQLESYSKAVGAVRWSALQLESLEKAIIGSQWSPAELEGHGNPVSAVQRPPSHFAGHNEPASLVQWTPSQPKGCDKPVRIVQRPPAQHEGQVRIVSDVQWSPVPHNRAISDVRWSPKQLEAINKAQTELENHNKAFTQLESYKQAFNKALRELEVHNKALRELEGRNTALTQCEGHEKDASVVRPSPTHFDGHNQALNALPQSTTHVRYFNVALSSQMSLPQVSQLPDSSQATQSDPNTNEEEVEEGLRAEQGHKGHWTLEQLLILCTARHEDWKSHGQGASGKVAYQSADQRWSSIADKCLEQGAIRSARQCKDKWEQIRADFTKVYEYERDLSSWKPSYWTLPPGERKRKLRLKTVMKREIFDHLKTWAPNNFRALEPGDVMDSSAMTPEPAMAMTPDIAMAMTPEPATALVSDLNMATTPDPDTAMAADWGMTPTSDPGMIKASDLGAGGGGGGVEHEDSGGHAPLDCASPNTKDKSAPKVEDAFTSAESDKKEGLTAASEEEDAQFRKEALEVAKQQLSLEEKKHEDNLLLERERIAIAKDFSQGFIGALSAIGNAIVMIASGMVKDKEG